jgi:hypothetical protein
MGKFVAIGWVSSLQLSFATIAECYGVVMPRKLAIASSASGSTSEGA